MTRRSIYPNPHNIPFLALPLTGPHAIGERKEVAGSIPLPDGRHLLIAVGEYCEWRVGPPTWVRPENIVPADEWERDWSEAAHD